MIYYRISLSPNNSFLVETNINYIKLDILISLTQNKYIEEIKLSKQKKKKSESLIVSN